MNYESPTPAILPARSNSTGNSANSVWDSSMAPWPLSPSAGRFTGF